MKNFIVIITLLLSWQLNAQTIKFKVPGVPDTTVHLVRYYGKKLYYADTAVIQKGIVEFNGSKQKAGILALMLPGQKLLEFIYNDEAIEIESKLPDLLMNEKVKKSKENQLFVPYMKFMRESSMKADSIRKNMPDKGKDSIAYKKAADELDEINEGVKQHQLKLIDEYSDYLLAKIIKFSMDIEIPEPPVDENGELIDSNFRFNYYFEHYWDNCDFTDDRLIRGPVFQNKLEGYFSSRMMIQHWDTIIKYAYDFCDRLTPGSQMFEYCVSWITSNYERSKIMGMNKVFVFMGKRYYCPDPAGFTFMDSTYYCLPNEKGDPPAFWMPADKLETLCEKVNTHFNLVMGQTPPNITLLDTTERKWVDYYSLDNEFTVLYFWDPQCGHCKKITPKLQTLYEKKFKERNIDIFAVGKAVGDDFEKWKQFIKDNNLEFINVGLTKSLYEKAQKDAASLVPVNGDPRPKPTTLESLNYTKTFDIFATPKVWVLDKDKKIIAYSLTISQLEEMLDRLQGHEDDEKLFPPEEDVEEEQMH